MEYIENVSDQLDGFSEEVAGIIGTLMREYGYTFEQSSRIVEIAVKDIESDILHHLFMEIHKIIECGITVNTTEI